VNLIEWYFRHYRFLDRHDPKAGEKMKNAMLWILIIVVFPTVSTPVLFAQAEGESSDELDDDADLAQELTNPLANLMTIPIQTTYNQDIGLGDEGEKLQTNIQLGTSFWMIFMMSLPV
jgi:hypothetical protein